MPRQNPIEDYEYLHQIRLQTHRKKSLALWFNRLLIVYAIIAAFVSGFTLLNAVVSCENTDWFWLSDLSIKQMLNVSIAIGLPVIIATFTIPFQSHLLGLNSIRREKAGENWSLLRITSVTGQQLVRGKWWATLRSTRRSYIKLILFRMGYLIFLVVDRNRYFYLTSSNYERGIACDYNTQQISILSMMAVALLFVALHESVLFSAMGIFSSLIEPPSIVAPLVNLALFLAVRVYSLWAYLYVLWAVDVYGHLIMGTRQYVPRADETNAALFMIITGLLLPFLFLKTAQYIAVRFHRFNPS